MVILAALSQSIISSREKRNTSLKTKKTKQNSIQLFLHIRISEKKNLWKFVFSYARASLSFSHGRTGGFRIHSHKVWIGQNLEIFFKGQRIGKVQMFYKYSFIMTGGRFSFLKRPFRLGRGVWSQGQVCTSRKGVHTVSCLVPRSDSAGRAYSEWVPSTELWRNLLRGHSRVFTTL